MVNGLPDATKVVFDDERAVANAGVLLPAMLADRLGIEALVDRTVDLGDQAGAGNAGRKVMSLVSAMALGADCIDDCDVLRSGQTRAVLGHRLSAPSTLGTFLRAFTFGHVRQLDRVLAVSLKRAWAAGAGPGDDQLVVDVDSFVGEVYGYEKQGAGYGYTHKRGYHPIIATRSGTGEVLHVRARKGSANTSRGALRFVEELIPRVQRAGASGPKLLRADSGFWNQKIMARLERAGWAYSIAVRQQPHVKAADRCDPRDRLAAPARLPRGWGGADRADDARPPAADRSPHPTGGGAGRAVARLAALRVFDQPHRRDRARRSRAPPARRRGTRDP
jgi:Transposase DDE domain group 1